jgi:hypothetical protein
VTALITASAWALAGLAAGLVHAGLLWRQAAGRPGVLGVLGFAPRLALVVALLLGASLVGALGPASAGWSLGFAAGLALVSWRTAP